MADQLSYSLNMNGIPCDVRIEWLDTADAPAAAAGTEKAASSAYGSLPTPYPAKPVFAGPTQAAWVTARRVAHLPFH